MIFKFLNKIRLWLYSFRIRYKTEDNFIDHYVAYDILQQDARAMEMIKRVKKAFEQQQQAINNRVLKMHDPACPDIFNCTKSACFKREPDKIVSDPYRVKRKE